MMNSTSILLFNGMMLVLMTCGGPKANRTNSYDDLVALFKDLRALERPSFSDGVPDYTAGGMAGVKLKLKKLQVRFDAIEPGAWPIEQKVDRELVRAELNGLDFDLRVLQPWVRDPAYYVLIFADQSDTPTHEGPMSHAAIELWQYKFPLSPDDAKKLIDQLKVIPPLLEQARTNLTGNARDLWTAGVRNIRDQVSGLDDLAKKTVPAGPELSAAIADAKTATEKFAEWVSRQATNKTGPSGIGKENYNWYLRHVLLVPLTWDDEAMILKRELTRSYASLALEQQHNRNLPTIVPAASQEEYVRRADRSAAKMMKFLKDKEILPVRDYMEPELRKHLGGYQPEEKRNFFLNILHREAAVLYSHSTHWFDIGRMNAEPHPSLIRRDPLPYNIWLHRSEGLATAMEEIFMNAGLHDDNPRARELVWIMLAQRCARGLASLYAHVNEIDYDQARAYQVEWTPAGWTGDVSLVGFEQHLYLRLPGYGPSYVTGKYLIERLMMERSRQLGEKFKLYDFFGEMYGTGMIPISLIRWQMLGKEDELAELRKSGKPN